MGVVVRYMAITDEKLVQDFLRGEQKALETLIDRYLKPLYNFSFHLVGDGQVAEDIVQETFVKVWKHAASFDGSKKFSTWVFAIAKNAAYDFLKKKKTLPFSSFENEEGNSVLENIEDETILYSEKLLARMDAVSDVQDFLSSLSPQAKAIILLHHQQGFSLVEIAKILDTPANTIKSKYHRAIIFLKNMASSAGIEEKAAPETSPAS